MYSRPASRRSLKLTSSALPASLDISNTPQNQLFNMSMVSISEGFLLPGYAVRRSLYIEHTCTGIYRLVTFSAHPPTLKGTGTWLASSCHCTLVVHHNVVHSQANLAQKCTRKALILAFHLQTGFLPMTEVTRVMKMIH